MTQNERLRALLKEARECINTEWDSNLKTIALINAALAEPGDVHTSNLTDVITLLENDRDKARAEVERLRALLDGVVGACKYACSRDSHCGVCAIALQGINP